MKDFEISLSLTPSQVLRFNELLQLLKDVAVGRDPKDLQNFLKNSPREFLLKVLNIPLINPPKVKPFGLTDLKESQKEFDLPEEGFRLNDIFNVFYKERT